MKSLVAALLVALTLPATAYALGPGSVDASFGTGGAVFTRLGPLAPPGESVTHARDLAIAPGVGLLVAGSAPDADEARALALVRYRPNGKLDPGFGERGVVVRQLGAGDARASAATAVLAEPDGGAIVAGNATDLDGRSSVLLVRFAESGRIVWATQQQFAANGDSTALELTRDLRGRIVVVGRAGDEPFVARFDAGTGGLDFTFAERGYVVDPAPRDAAGENCAFGSAQANAVHVEADGSLLVGGTLDRTCADDRPAPVALMRRFDETGTAPTTLGDVGVDSVSAMSVAPFRDGVVLAGSVAEDGALVPAVARLVADSLDVDFPGPSGFGPLPGYGGRAGAVTSLTVAGSDGKLLLGVDLEDPEQPDRIVRTDAGGMRDEGFAAGSLLEAQLRTPRASVVQADGRIVVVGERAPYGGRDEQGFALARLFGSEELSTVTVRARAALRKGYLRLRVACSEGPGCAGVVRGRRVGVTAYEIAGGRSARLAVPVRERDRDEVSLAVSITNPPDAAVRRTVNLSRRAGAGR